MKKLVVGLVLLSAPVLATALRNFPGMQGDTALGWNSPNGSPVIRPSLDLNFAVDKTLDSRITFTRASSATYFDSAGVMQTASTNVARFDHNPSTLASLGLLVEEQRTNLALRSAEFNTTWSILRILAFGSGSVTDAINGLDGTLTADVITEDTANDTHFIRQGITVSTATAYTFSVFAKAKERSIITLGDNASTLRTATFTLSGSGTVSSIGGSLTSAGIQSFPNGWYRCWIIYTTATTLFNADIGLRTAAGAGFETYTGDGTSGVYLWGAQLEAGAFPTSYIPTTSATVTRSADFPSMTGTNFSSWFRQSEGTFSVAFSVPVATTDKRRFAWHIDDNGFDRLNMRSADSSVATAAIGTGASVITLVGVAPVSGQTTKLVLSYGVGMAFAQNGTLAATSASTAAVASGPSLFIGNDNTNIGQVSGTISRLTFYPARLTNAQVQALSN